MTQRGPDILKTQLQAWMTTVRLCDETVVVLTVDAKGKPAGIEVREKRTGQIVEDLTENMVKQLAHNSANLR